MQKSFESVICPKCDKKLRPPFRACREEHIVCPHCKQHQNANTGAAEESKGCLGKEFSMQVLNKMFKNTLDYCQYDCGYRTNLLDLQQHEKSCSKSKKILVCAFPNCQWNGVTNMIIQHVDHNHPDQLMVLSKHDQGFAVSFANPVLLVIQFDKNNPVNELYWLRLFEHSGNRYVILLHHGVNICEDGIKQNFKKFSISSSEQINHFIKGDIITHNRSADENITNNNFIRQKGLNISALKGNSYIVKVKNSKEPVIPESVLSMLECMVCLDEMYAPIRQCETGHSFCTNCAEKMKKCPTCRKKLTQTRNYALEHLSENLGIRCKYREGGCIFAGQKASVELHSQNCVFQLTECGIFRCDWSGTYNDISNHWKEQHYDRIKTNGMTYTSGYCWLLYHVAGNNLLFKGMYDIDNCYFSVYHLTYQTDTDFHFDVEFVHPSTGHSVCFSRPCLASTADNIKKFEYLLNADNVCKVPKSWFSNVICDTNGNCTITVNIYRKNV